LLLSLLNTEAFLMLLFSIADAAHSDFPVQPTSIPDALNWCAVSHNDYVVLVTGQLQEQVMYYICHTHKTELCSWQRALEKLKRGLSEHDWHIEMMTF